MNYASLFLLYLFSPFLQKAGFVITGLAFLFPDDMMLSSNNQFLLSNDGWMRQLGGVDMHNVTFPLRTPDAFHGSGFCPPDELQSVHFNPFHFFRRNIKRLGMKVTDK